MTNRVKIKLDECLSTHLKSALQQLGYDTDTAQDEGLAGQTDETIIEHAFAEGRMLFTFDKGLVDARQYPAGTHPGLVLFRGLASPDQTQTSITEFVRTTNLDRLAGCIVTVGQDLKTRVRRPTS